MSDTNARDIVERAKANPRKGRESASHIQVQQLLASLRTASRRSPARHREDAVAQVTKGRFVGRR
jgi:hypothetical protein